MTNDSGTPKLLRRVALCPAAASARMSRLHAGLYSMHHWRTLPTHCALRVGDTLGLSLTCRCYALPNPG
jgi:hypothetical protein